MNHDGITNNARYIEIGLKIAYYRKMNGLTQEQLAESLGVSRQSVSKWEMDQAQPQIDKILQLCELFNISADELLYDKISINRSPAGAPIKNKYFGTDGFRGEANLNLTSLQAYKVGRFLGLSFHLFFPHRQRQDGLLEIYIWRFCLFPYPF